MVTDTSLSDTHIIASWHKNASPWTQAVRGQQIESRRLVTDEAVLDAVLSRSPRSVLDIGCGEGWLSHALQARGIAVTGVDVVPALVDAARRGGPGDFRVLSYEQIAQGQLSLRVDLVVCNFSLLGKESVDALIGAMPSLLKPSGYLVVQTLHPLIAGGGAAYCDGWREGSWAGFDGSFCDPAPWYFRTLGSWLRLIGAHGLSLQELREPLHPRTQQPASVIFIAQRP